MDEMHLTAEDESQLRGALANAPANIKDGFCNCWPNVKALLDWLANHVKSGIIKWLINGLIWLGDHLYKLIGCKPQGVVA